jgi:hypothetical protein
MLFRGKNLLVALSEKQLFERTHPVLFEGEFVS